MAARKQHQHSTVWTMGEHPVVARCRTCSKVMVNGGTWVTAKQAEAQRRKVGWRAAL